MEIAPPSMALVCVISSAATNSQNLLPIPVEVSLNTLSAVVPSEISLKKLLPPDF
jgi:hypothetical protein